MSNDKKKIDITIPFIILLVVIGVYIFKTYRNIKTNNDDQPIDSTSFINQSFAKDSTSSKELEIATREKNEIGTKDSNDDFHKKAYIIAKQIISKELSLPVSASFENGMTDWGNLGNNEYVIKGSVDFNMQRTYYQIKLKYKSGDWSEMKNWEKISFENESIDL